MAKVEQKIKFIYDLTPMQEGMLFHYLHNSQSNAYLEISEILINGSIDLVKFESAFNELVNRHDILRTVFAFTKVAKPRQVVLNSREAKVQIIDFSNEKNADFLAGEFIENARKNQFDLSKDILIRLSLIVLPDNKMRIVWSFHHIIMDGWCFSLLLNDFFQLYAAQLQNRQHQLPIPTDFGVYLKWLSQQKREVSAAFWKKQMSLDEPAISIKKERSKQTEAFVHEVKTLLLPTAMKSLIENYVSAQQTSINIYLQTLWSVLLQKLNNTTSSFFGTVVSGRPPEIPNVDSIIGLFINTVPVCADFLSCNSFQDALEQIQSFYNDSRKHDYFPLAEILSYAPMDQRFLEHIFVFENLDKDVSKSKSESNIGFEVLELEMHEQTDLDLDISIYPTDDSLLFKFSFNANLFSIKEITTLQERLVSLISQTLANPDIALADLKILSQAEENQLLHEFNITEADYPKDQSFVSLFEQQVELSPDKTALVFKEQKLSYTELNAQANQFAHYLLQTFDLKAEDRVAIQLPRNELLLVAVLGVMKTGAAYIPVDPDYPQERIDFMLADSGAKLVVDEESFTRFLTPARPLADGTGSVRPLADGTGSIRPLADGAGVSNLYNLDNTGVKINPNELAYIIYTSGSTGLPKGVMIEQHSLVNAAFAWKKAYQLDQMEVNLLQMASFSFDVFVGDMLRTFVNGGTMVLCPSDWRLDPVTLSQALIDYNISLLEATPGLIIPLMDYVWEQQLNLPALKLLILGSDTCAVSSFLTLQERFGKELRIVNSYGVTEATIDSSFFEGEVLSASLPIGKPLQNTKYYVLDRHQKPVPLGTTGELYIGGAGLARGYHGQEELTAEKFIINPLNASEKLYRTGDLAYWLADGNLCFVGRADSQVKIRGYRIELGEIENALLKIEGVKEVAVVDRKDNMGVSYLCAYFRKSESVSETRKLSGVRDFAAQLAKVLPEYMIPAHFVELDQIPLTPNGKIDRKALPAPDVSLGLASAYEAPRNETEEKLAAIWQDILGVERVGINDNFFELGGHSLKAMVLVSRIHKELEVKISLQKLFESPTIAGVSAEISGSDKSDYQAIVPCPVQEHYTLSSAQKRLWILDRIQGGSVDYNIFSLLSFEESVQFDVLQKAFDLLISRHESIRTNFIEVDGEPRQLIHPTVKFELGYFDASERTDQQAFIEDEYRKESSFSFDLKSDLLLRATLVKEHESKWHLILNMHHIISDGWSIGILEQELLAYYKTLIENKQPSIVPLAIQYKDFALWQQQLVSGNQMQAAKEFWHKTFRPEGLETAIPVTELPSDFAYIQEKNHTGSQYIHLMDAELSRKITELAKQQQSSLFMVLLSAFSILLQRLSSSNDILIGTPVAGRSHQDLKSLIGFFLNTVILRYKVEPEQSFNAFLSSVKQQTLLSLQHQDYPFEQLIDELKIPRDINRFPLTSIFFNMLNIEDGKPEKIDVFEAKHVMHNHKVKFDLNVYAKEYENGIQLIWDYKNELFLPASIENFARQFTSILELAVLNPAQALKKISTGKAILKTSDFGSLPFYNEQQTINRLLQESSVKFADQIAISSLNEQVTYRELNAQSSQLARLLAQEIRGGRIAFCVEHNHLTALAICSILKSGNSYVPLDPDYPLQRSKFVLDDSKAAFLLCDLANLALAKQLFPEEQIICIDAPDAPFKKLDDSDFFAEVSPESEAYVLYTSGSSGQPKGVSQTHLGVVHFADLYISAISIEAKDKLSGFSSVSFDSFNHELFPALFSGASYCPVSLKTDLGVHQIAAWIEEKQISIWQSVPTVFRQFTEEIKEQKTKFDTLRLVKMTGEASQKDDFESFKLITNSHAQFAVSYGSTENSLTAFKLFQHHSKINKANLAAGRILNRTEIRILDTDLQAVDFLQSGDIFLHSNGMSKGYLNEELNADAFVLFEGKRFFKTGDTAIVSLDGELELKGRKDGQLKIRGMRIELGEIEAALRSYPGIKQAFVNPVEREAQLTLAAYYQAENDIDLSVIKIFLAGQLPVHMLPSVFIRLEQFPFTTSGKIDRLALPKPDWSPLEPTSVYQPAENELQQKLIDLWQNLLASKLQNDKVVGILDNFFELGGHSLMASSFVAQLEKQLQLILPLRQVFLNPTIKDLAAYLQNQAQKSTKSSIKSQGGAGIYQASSAQKRLYVLSQINDKSTNYNMSNVLVLKGKPDIKRVEQVFQSLIDRHESLRTTFDFDKGELWQQVHESVSFKLDFLQLDVQQAHEWIMQAVNPFDLSSAPLLRATVIETEAEEYLLFTDMHHIISDGSSVENLSYEFTQLYAGKELAPLPVQYKDYTLWQLENSDLEKQQQFWIEEFSSEITGESIPVLELPIDFARPAVFSQEGNQISIEIDAQTTQELKFLLQKQGATLYMGLLSAFYILLHKYSRQSDIVIGTPVAGRNHADLEAIIGMFVNTLALRQLIDPQQSFSNFLDQVKDKSLLAFENQEYPFSELLDQLDVQKQFSRNALFDVVFVLQNILSKDKVLSDLRVEGYGQQSVQAKFDLTLLAREENDKIYLNFQYASTLFTERSITQIAQHFSALLKEIVLDPNKEISAFELLSENEKHQLLVDFNQSDAEFPKEETILSLFEKQVTATPDNVAVVFENDSLTYAELNALSNQLARFILDNCAVQADDKIAILLDRSQYLLVSILAILKTGACYVPIDPTYPHERIDFMLSDSAAKLVIDEDSLNRFLTVSNTYSIGNTGVLRNPNDLAYIIYTSGSTGQPKGVMIEDRQVVRLLFNDKNRFDFSSSDVWTLFHSYCFDFSVWEMYGALLYGGKLIVVPKIVAQSTPEFRNLVQAQGVTVLNQTPGSFYNFIPEELAQNEALLSLRYVIFGGEALSPAKLSEFKTRYPKNKLINMYGITETTVHVTYKEITEKEIQAGISNIGVPIPTLQVYILSPNQQLLPIGVAGELCVAGAGLARGYLNREELTESVFVNNPWIPNEKLYRSGDLARFLPNGELEYLGRIDKQVKIRGFRIELGEIEAKMLSLGVFDDVVVIDRKDHTGASYLCAYFKQSEKQSENEDIKSQLAMVLPDYMIPSYFVQLENIPLTSNGKVDSLALPEPNIAANISSAYEAPQNETQQKLVEIWQEVLGIEKVGINDNFFELGGHSLKATQVNSRIQLHFGVRIPLKEFFLNQTIAQQSVLLKSNSSGKAIEITKAPVQEYYPLSHAQKSFWLSEKMGMDSDFKISTAVRIDGELNLEGLESAFQHLVDYHESFRSSFIEIGGQPMQEIASDLSFVLARLDLRESINQEVLIEQEIKAENALSFKLNEAPLIRAKLLQLSDKESVLLLTVHHIIADGWSMDLLVKQIIQLYTNSGFSINKDQNALQYKDFAHWQSHFLSPEKLQELSLFWNKHLDGKLEHLDLPTDKNLSAQATFIGRFKSLELSQEQYQNISGFLRSHHVTMNSFLLAAYNVFLSKIARTDEITVRTISSGREHLALESVIGVFVKTFVIKNYPKHNKSFVQFVQEVHERSLAAQEHNDYPFENLVAELMPGSASNRNVANVAFALQNLNTVQTRETAELKELNFSQIERSENYAKSDLLLTASEYDKQLNLSFNYNTDLFTDAKIELFLEQFTKLIDSLLAGPLLKMEDIALSISSTDKLLDLLDLSTEEFEAVYPATTVQRDLYLDSIIHPEALAHNLALIIRPKHNLNLEIWDKAVNYLIEKTEILRSRIFANNQEVYVAIKKESPVSAQLIDVRDMNLSSQDDLYSFIEANIKQPYQLDREALVRNLVLRVSDEQYFIILGAHHAIIDGWSYTLFFERAAAIYMDLLEGKIPTLTEDKDFGAYAEKHLSQFDSPSTLSYWKEKLAGIENLDFKVIGKKQNELKTIETLIPFDSLAKVESYCKTNKISVPLFYKALYGYTLNSYCHATADFIIHEVVSNRSRENDLSMGCFYHSIPLRFDQQMLQSAISPENYFEFVKNQKKDLGDRQHISAMSRSRLMQEEKTAFFFNFHPNFTLQVFGEEVEMDPIMTYSPGQVHFSCRMTNEGLKLFLFHYTDDFEDFDFLKRILSLSDQITDGAAALSELNLVLTEEKQVLMANPWEKTTYPEKLTIHGRIEDQAALFPNHIAVVSGNKHLTYFELNSRANQLAHYLNQNHIISFDDRIALITDRTELMLIGMLAILKTGAAYVPVDPNYPQDRIQYLLDDCGAELILCDSKFDPTINPNQHLIKFDRIDLSNFSVLNLHPTSTPENLAYIIYTSGTTGQPKGTMIEHRNVIRLLINSDFQFDFNEKDVWTLFHSYSFDFSVWEIFGALFYGGKIVIVPKETAQVTSIFRKLLLEESVTVLNQIPNIFLQLIEEDAKNAKDLNSLRYIVFGGDMLKPASLKGWKQKYPDCKLINMYGITETTVHVTYKEISDDDIEFGLSNIGKTIPTLRSFIFDSNQRLLPLGLPGEIIVVGAGLARGYLNRAELTDEKFIHTPLALDPWIPNERLYRSGDLGRLLPNGDIEYLGRIDQQVKVRGFRIELGEIENALHRHQAISSALVLAKKMADNETTLIAYFVAETELKTAEIRAHLSQDLPDYMLPQYFIQLEVFPLTSNGKIDRKALPDPKLSSLHLSSDYVEASSFIEKDLLSIWKEVLDVERIGITDNFFDLGGHSLKAVQLIGSIHRVLEVEISIRQLFSAPTIQQLASIIESSEQSNFEHIKAIGEKENYEASPAQTRLWLLDQIHEGTADYNMPGSFVFERNIDATLLEKAFVALIERHEVLRTNIKAVDGNPKQFIRSTIDFKLEQLNVAEADNFQMQFQEQYQLMVNHTFNLAKDWLIKACLIEEKQDKFHLILVLHHIITDGWSMEILHRELSQIYVELEKQQTSGLSPIKIQYKDFAYWQNRQLQGSKLAAYRKFWHETLSGELPILNLPSDGSEKQLIHNSGARYYTFLSAETSEKIKELSVQNKASTFMTLIALFKVLLHRLSGQDDIIIGTPVAGREHEDLKNLIGFFLNTVMLRNQVNRSQSFASFLEQVRDNTLEALQYQAYPFEQLVDELDIPRQVNRFPISSVFFNMGAFGSEGPGKHNLKQAHHDEHGTKVKFDLNIYASEYENGIVLACDYKNELFKARTIEVFFEKLEQIINQIVSDPNKVISEIKTKTELAESEKLLLPDWYNPQESIATIFDAQWAKFAERTAILGEFQTLNYAELDHCTTVLAQELQQKNKIGSRIGICVGHNENMAVAVVAALKASLVYVPLDPDYPIDRLRFIAQESGILTLITDSENEAIAAQLNSDSLSTYVIDLPDLLSTNKAENQLKPIKNPEADAYILYTSGSTGMPKGAIQTQAGIQHFIANYTAALKLNQNDRITGFSSISYDSFVNDLFGALFNGACYCPVSLKKGKAINELGSWVKENKLTVWHSVPTVFRQLAAQETLNKDDFATLRILKMTGEASTKRDWDLFKNLSNDQAAFVVSYGSTESTLTAIKSYSHSEAPEQAILSAGRAINETEILIVNSDLQTLDVLEPGEILIHHAYLVKAYLNNPDLNEKVFITLNGKRYYRSFDLGKLDLQGNLHLLGRADDQLKIRGMRIELGEIENALLQHQNILQSAVSVHSNDQGEASLTAYFVANEELFSSNLRNFLSQSLPEHMIPLQFVALESLPLTPNGKIDRKALPVPSGNTISSGIDFAEAANEIEVKLLGLWRKVLGKTDESFAIGVNDNFFDLGGHSLRATQLAALIHEHLEVKMKLKSLFLYPSIAEQAKLIAALEKDHYAAIEKIASRAHYDLSSSQKRLWLLDKLSDGNQAYNMSKAFLFEGDVKAAILERALQCVIDRHESLRTNFIEISGEPQQVIHPKLNFSLERKSIVESPEDEKLQEEIKLEFERTFDLANEPLIRASLLSLGEDRFAFLFTMHHIISDGWSMGVLAQELLGAYNSLLNARPLNWADLPIQYKDYASWHNRLIEDEKSSSLSNFWKKNLSGNLPVLQIPTDFMRPDKKSSSGSMLDFVLDQNTYTDLLQIVKEEELTLYMFLLGHLNLLLHKYSGQNDIVIGSPVAGRNHNFLKSQIGFYVNTIVLRSRFDAKQTISELLQSSKQTALDAFDHQEYPFDLLVNEIGAKRDPSRSPIFDIALVLQNTEDATSEELKMDAVRISPISYDHGSSKFDLTFNFYQNGDELAFRIEYNTDLFKKESIRLMGMRLQHLLQHSRANLNVSLDNLTLSSAIEEAIENQQTDLEEGFEF